MELTDKRELLRNFVLGRLCRIFPKKFGFDFRGELRNGG